MHIHRNDQNFILSVQKSLFWIEQKMLVIADAHFSKETHFRKNGIAVPYGILSRDLMRLDILIDTFEPEQILFLGDMFHSDENEGLLEFIKWRKKRSEIEMKLVIGNHDILEKKWYEQIQIQFFDQQYLVENVLFSHDKNNIPNKNLLNLYGHIHPCTQLRGKAKQSLRLPCFWFSEYYGALPAFGRFTGSVAIRPSQGDAIFVIGDSEVVGLPICV